MIIVEFMTGIGVGVIVGLASYGLVMVVFAVCNKK